MTEPGDPPDPASRPGSAPGPGQPSGAPRDRDPRPGSAPDQASSSADPREPGLPPASVPAPGIRPDPEPRVAPPLPPGVRADLDRTVAAVWTLPFAVAVVVALALPWATCPGCGGPAVFTAWSLPDSDVIGVSTGAEYGLCSIGGVLALVLTAAALATLRPSLAALGALVAAVTAALGAYAIVTIARHGLNVEAGAPVTVCGAAVLTITLVRVRARLVDRH